LAINGFAWLENGRESEWIKIKQQGSATKEELIQNTNTKQDLRTYGFS
jgi:hypothetical protein